MSNPDPHVTDDERAKVVRLLTESRDVLLAAVAPLSEAQWVFKPGLDRWSIGEIIEHLGLVERGLFSRVEKALATPANAEWTTATARKTELLERQLVDRGVPRPAPEHVVPTGTVGRDGALRIYTERRERSLAFAKGNRDPLKAHTQDHQRPVYGTLNAYQWLLFIPLHNIRHIQQIEEIKTLDGFPQ